MRITTCLFGAALAAQTPSLPHVVLTELPGGSPAAALVEVDPSTGALTPLPRFSSDLLRPLAVAFDAIDGGLLVALANGAQSELVRLERFGAGFAEFPIATLPGEVAALAAFGDDLLVAIDDTAGGLYRVPRRGGAPAAVLTQGNLTAAQTYPASSVVQLAWTGRAGTPVTASGTGLWDLATAAWAFGPYTFANPNGVDVTGVIDMPTAVPRQFLSFSDGTFAMFAGIIGPSLQPVPTSPAVPAGGAAAMQPQSPFSVAGIVVGGAAFPFVYEVDPFSGAVTNQSAALPGDPVDVAPGRALTAEVVFYGAACGGVGLGASSSGLPQPGATVTLGVSGPPATPLFLVGGLSDFALAQIPAVLPGGCALEVSPDVATLVITDGLGNAGLTLAVPAGPGWLGTMLYFQWLHFAAAGISTSAANAIRIGS